MKIKEQKITIITAAGFGKRMKNNERKQFLLLDSKPILFHSINKFSKCNEIDKIILVVNKEGIEYVKKEIVAKFGINKVIAVIEGGKERQDSVYNGITYLYKNNLIQNKEDIILIHDGVRPFVTEEIIHNSIMKAQQYGGSVVGVPLKDTVKTSDNSDPEDIFYKKTLDRNKLLAVQTPQVFQADLIYKAFKFAYDNNFYGTDDASLMEYYIAKNNLDLKICYTEGSYFNIKITTPEDMIFAKSIQKSNNK